MHIPSKNELLIKADVCLLIGENSIQKEDLTVFIHQ